MTGTRWGVLLDVLFEPSPLHSTKEEGGREGEEVGEEGGRVGRGRKMKGGGRGR